MDPHVELEYRGQPVTLLYSMDVLFDASERFGSVRDMLTLLGAESREGFEAVRWMFMRMAHEGELARRENGEKPREDLPEDLIPQRLRPGEYTIIRDACTKAVELGYRREEDDEEAAEEDEGLAELRAKKAGDAPTARRSRTAG